MDRVMLLPQHMTNVKIMQKTGGGWVDGEWVEGEEKEIIFQGGIFPLKPNDFKNYPEGFLHHDDRKLITKQKLNNQDEIYTDNKKFIIITSQDYGYLADTCWYVIRESKVV